MPTLKCKEHICEGWQSDKEVEYYATVGVM